MPNWCSNYVEVMGEDAVSYVKETQMDFEKIKPVPDGDIELEHWGTKWNSQIDTDDIDDDATSIIAVQFATAWSPSLPVTLEISKKFPDAQIYHSFQDESDDFYGVAIFTGGVGNVYTVPFCRPNQVSIDDRKVHELLQDILAHNWKCSECMDDDDIDALKHNEDGQLICESCYDGETPCVVSLRSRRLALATTRGTVNTPSLPEAPHTGR
jgi:hypothetical protein